MRKPLLATALLTGLVLTAAPAHASSVTTVHGPSGNWASVNASIGAGRLTVRLPQVSDAHDEKCTWVILLVRLQEDSARRVVTRWQAATNRNCSNRTRALPTFTRNGVERAWAQLCVRPATSPPAGACSTSWTRLI
ncbi:hypothetical protein ACFSKW_31685 [Nonomuraea mangrovi]|uniref:Secreted protein n=1 Tax=Nonomuraea mangrovi TaxID=2316207 RepID=A0ABW4T5G7_9ACTN